MTEALHQRFEQMLQSLACDLGASECHGILCGMLSGPNLFDPRLWVGHFSAQDDMSAYGEPERAGILEELVAQTRLALEAEDFEFHLLLPPEDMPLGERARAFAAWCRGFMSGLGLSGLSDLNILGEDARDFLRDLERFGAIELDSNADEGDEVALMELTEFTRMGVMIVRAEAQNELNAERNGDDPHDIAPVLH